MGSFRLLSTVASSGFQFAGTIESVLIAKPEPETEDPLEVPVEPGGTVGVQVATPDGKLWLIGLTQDYGQIRIQFAPVEGKPRPPLPSQAINPKRS